MVMSSSKECSLIDIHTAILCDDFETVVGLLQYGVDLQTKDKYGRTPLHIAVERNRTAVIELLLTLGVDTNCGDVDGRTPLHAAAWRGYDVIVKNLLDHGANVDCACTSRWGGGCTPLHLASAEGNIETIKLFVKYGADINICTSNKLTPLHIATAKEQETAVKLLLGFGAKVDSEDNGYNSVLLEAVETGNLVVIEYILKYSSDVRSRKIRNIFKDAALNSGWKHKKIVKKLLECGVSIDPEEVNNNKLLYAAVSNGYSKIVEDLLKYGADVNVIHRGFSLLHVAAKEGHDNIVKLLIEHGLDGNTEDRNERIPLFYAIQNNHNETVKLLLANGSNIQFNPILINYAIEKCQTEIIDAIIEHYDTIVVDSSDQLRQSALHHAMSIDDQHHCELVVNKLLRRGANVNAVTNLCETPLYIASKRGCKAIVKCLLENKANVSAKGRDGITAIHIAAQEGHKEVVEILLDNGADVDITDDFGSTPLHHTCMKGQATIVRTLLERGSDINIIDKYQGTALKYTKPFYNQSQCDSLITESILTPREILHSHIIKMKLANIYVCDENMLLLKNVPISKEIETICHDEIVRMSATHIGNSDISYYDLLRGNENQLHLYLQNGNILTTLESGGYKTMFPVYGNIIHSCFNLGMKRLNFIKACKLFMKFVGRFELPEKFILKLFTYLSNEDKKNVLLSYSLCNL